jgi:hypothetical protein
VETLARSWIPAPPARFVILMEMVIFLPCQCCGQGYEERTDEHHR